MAEPGPPNLTTQVPDPPTPIGSPEPSTVTHGFLFADLRGYTRYVDTHGDHAAAELRQPVGVGNPIRARIPR